jgi:type I restriction enzyme R subunit
LRVEDGTSACGRSRAMQNLDSQKKEFIQPFFSTIQWVMAGNDTEGLRYGTIETPEKYYLTWKEEGPASNLLDKALVQLCGKSRFLELIHDFVVFDAGIKKLCRHSQFFGVRAAQDHVRRREGGIIWHTQGSGKSLIMVWLAKWIRENAPDARVLIITDRTELDEQIEKVFNGVRENIYRTSSGKDLVETLNATRPWLICSLVHKFGGKEDGQEVGDIPAYVAEVKKALPADFKPKGNLFVFVDECHRTQSGELHKAMKAILPQAVFIGFTGTPLLKADKRKSIEVFGSYIHTYKFDEAVKDKVVLDLRYEARNIDQHITSQSRIDQWFDAKTRELTDLAKAQLKQRWGTMRKVLSSQSRLGQIAADILMDMETRDRLSSGHGNALLIAGSIYEACKFYELFSGTDLKGRCAIVTSYRPTAADIKGEESGEGETDRIEKYNVYREMLAEWFNQPPEKAVNRIDEFEEQVKKKFVNEPGQMKLLIVVDKLLTGFDAPPATYLYIDKQMRDHGLFQAICRVNRLDGDDKEYGHIVDYKDLFKSLEGAVHDYTSGALDGYDKEDVAGLLEDRLAKGKERLENGLEALRVLCEPVEPPKDQPAYFHYFSSREPGNAAQLKANEPQRLSLYRLTAALIRCICRSGWRDDRGGLQSGRRRCNQQRGQLLREPARRGEAAQRRCHRPETVRAGHAAPDRHLHSGRPKRDGIGLRRSVARAADCGTRCRCCERAAEGASRQQGGDGGNDREQRPPANHRRIADQPEVLRKDVGAARCLDRATQAGGDRLRGIPRQNRRADEAGSGEVIGDGAAKVSPSRDASVTYSTEAEERELDSRAGEILKLVTSQNEY